MAYSLETILMCQSGRAAPPGETMVLLANKEGINLPQGYTRDLIS